jgi:hypothetical protein
VIIICSPARRPHQQKKSFWHPQSVVFFTQRFFKKVIDISGFRAKGKQRELTLNWKEMNKLLVLPMKAPARFSGNPLGWLIEK